MARITFFIQSKNAPAGIYVRLREGVSIDAKAKTKFAINPNDWSSVKGQPKNLKSETFKALNNSLVQFKADLLSHYNGCIGKRAINSNWLKDFINPPARVNHVPTKVIEYFDYYIKHKESELSNSTIKKLGVNKKLIERFQKETVKEYFINDVDADFKLRFESYCLKEKYAPNTVARALMYVKTLCYHARGNRIETSHQLDNMKTKFHKGEKIFLSPEEIELIADTPFKKDYLDIARDWLLISCETGQRISDFMRFTKGHIRYEKEKPLIEFTQVKTDKIMAIPLSKKVMEILKKREGEFPRRISDQKYNDYIKDVCKIAGLTNKIKGSKKDPETERKVTGTFEKWELVTSHIGRRSFATNNYGRIPTSLLIGATGHSTEKQFLEYIGKTDTEKAMQLAEYF